MKILEAIIGGVGDSLQNTASNLGDIVSDPVSYLGDVFNNSGIKQLFSDPEEYAKFIEQMIRNAPANSRSSGGFAPTPYTQAAGPMAPMGGFVNQNPNFMNTDQLILRGLL